MLKLKAASRENYLKLFFINKTLFIKIKFKL